MDEMSAELEADVVEQTADLMSIANDSRDVDHAQVIEEFDSFAGNNPDIENFTSEPLQHGFVLPTIFAGIAIVQFMLACVVFASLIYFIIRDYMELQQRRRMHAGNVRVVAGEEHGGDNNTNNDEDDDDNDRRVAGLPPAAPEGTPPSQFPNDIVRRRGPFPALPPRPLPLAPPASSTDVLRPAFAVVQVSSRPLTLTVVDRSVAAAAATAAATASSADGGSMDDGTDIISRLQNAGAKPKKARYARKYQSIHKPRTTESNNEDTSSPTATDNTDVVSETQVTTTTTADSEQQHPASETRDSDVNTPQSTAAPPSRRSSTVDDRDRTADEEQTISVAALRTQWSAWTTTDDRAMSRPLRQAGLFDQAAASSPTSSLNTLQTDTLCRSFQQPQQQKSQHGCTVCENGVCRLRIVTSTKQCHDATSQASIAAADLPSTTLRDAKSESTASEAATSTLNGTATPLDGAVDVKTVSESQMPDDSSAVDAVEPSSRHSPRSAPAVDDIARHESTTPSFADRDELGSLDEKMTEQSVSLDALLPPDAVDRAVCSPSESLSLLPPTSTITGAAADHDPEHDDAEDVNQVTAWTATAESVVLQAPFIVASSDGVEELAAADTDSTSAL